MNFLKVQKFLKGILISNQTPLRSLSVTKTFFTNVQVDDDGTDDTSTEPLRDIEDVALTFTLPDLTPKETDFVKQQVRIVMKPECVAQAEEYLKNNEKSDIGLSDATAMEFIFPSKRGLYCMVSSVHQINKVYKKFKVPKKESERYGRNLTSPLMAQRVSEGLHLAGVKYRQLETLPELVLFTDPSYLTMLEFAESLNIPLKDFHRIRKGNIPLRGHFIHHYLERSAESLRKLNFSDEADRVQNLSFSGCDVVNLNYLFAKSSLPVLQGIANRRGLCHINREDFKLENPNINLTHRSPIHLARNYYLNYFILGWVFGDQTHFRSSPFRDVLAPSPLETLVTLNTYQKTLEGLDLKFSSPETFLQSANQVLLKLVFNAPLQLSIPMRKKLLQDIGFASEEIVKILLSPECLNFSDTSTGFRYQRFDYVLKMKERRENLLEQQPDLKDPVDLWIKMTNFKNFLPIE